MRGVSPITNEAYIFGKLLIGAMLILGVVFITELARGIVVQIEQPLVGEVAGSAAGKANDAAIK
jgi:hypothetical protein